jgi:uncharacterized protein YlxW (UPF0749 family)
MEGMTYEERAFVAENRVTKLEKSIVELEAKLDTANSKVINLENSVAAMRVTRDEMQKIIVQQDKGE